MDRRWKSLFGLDIVGTALRVESSGVGGIGINGTDGEDVGDELGKGRKDIDADSVGAVDVEWGKWASVSLIVSITLLVHVICRDPDIRTMATLKALASFSTYPSTVGVPV